MSDLVNVLRDCAATCDEELFAKAADRIESLERNFDALDAALRKVEAQRDGYLQEGLKLSTRIEALEAGLRKMAEAARDPFWDETTFTEFAAALLNGGGAVHWSDKAED